MGIYCISFECNQQVTRLSLSRLFWGLIQQGLWTCIDQFDKIDRSTLSVLTQYIINIRNGLKAGVLNNEITIEDKSMRLKQSVGIFFTSDPLKEGASMDIPQS